MDSLIGTTTTSFYARIKVEGLKDMLLHRDGSPLWEDTLTFHCYAKDRAEAKAWVSKLATMRYELKYMINDLIRFIDEYDFEEADASRE